MTAQLGGIPTQPFTLQVAGSERDTALLGCGLTALVSDWLSVYVQYDAAVNNKATAHAVTVGARINF